MRGAWCGVLAVGLLGCSLGVLRAEVPSAWQDFAETLRAPLGPRQHEVTLNRQAVTLAMIRKTPGDLKARMEVAETLFYLREYPRAADWFFSVISLDEHRTDAALRFAESLYLAGHVDSSLRAIRQLEKAGLSNSILPILVAEVAFKQKAYGICIARLERAKESLEGSATPDERLAEYLKHNLRVVRDLVE